jgi:hypothetical protein
MRRPRVRFTVRRLMVAVAVVAIGFWGLALVRVSQDYRQRASIAEGAERAADVLENTSHQSAWAIDLEADRIERDRANGLLVDVVLLETPERSLDSVVARMRTKATLSARDAARYGRIRRYGAYLKQKYRRAARYPWLPVAPDPPAPE